MNADAFFQGACPFELRTGLFGGVCNQHPPSGRIRWHGTEKSLVLRDADPAADNIVCPAEMDKAAHQLASLASAFNDLMPQGPAVMREGMAILMACEDGLRQLATPALKPTLEISN